MARAIKAGVAYVEIIPNLERFQAALNRGLKPIAKKMESVGKTLTRNVTVPLVAIGGAAAKLAVDFEDSLSKISGLVGIAKKDVDAMGESVLALAPKVGKGPKELADALFFITSSGFKGAEAMQILEASARAATAGLGSTVGIADAVTSAVNAYGIKALSAAQATDILTATVREGKGEASELAGVIGNVIPIASELGVEFDQVGAAIASMTLTGLDAAESVTALRQFFTLLLKPAQQSRERLDALGLSAADVAQLTGRLNLQLAKGSLSIDKLRKIVAEKGLFEGMNALSTAIGDNRDALGEVIPNVRALTGFLSITGKSAGKNAAIFKALAKATGSTDKAFDEAAQTARFKLNAGLASLQVTGIKLGNIMIPVIKRIAERITDLAGKFAALSPQTQNLILKIGGLALAAGPLARLIGLASTAVLGLGKSLIFLATNPLVALGAALALGVGKLLSWANRSNNAAAAARAYADALEAAKSASDRLSGATVDVERSSVDLQRANLDLKTSQNNLNAVRKSGTATAEELTSAELDVRDAQLRVRDAQNRLKLATQDQTKAREDLSIAEIQAGVALKDNITTYANAAKGLLGYGQNGQKVAEDFAKTFLPTIIKAKLTASDLDALLKGFPSDTRLRILALVSAKLVEFVDSRKSKGGEQEFAHGGFVKGPLNSPQLVTAHAGELVLTRDQQAALAYGPGETSVPGSVTVNVLIPGTLISKSPADFARQIVPIIRKELLAVGVRNGGTNRAFTR